VATSRHGAKSGVQPSLKGDGYGVMARIVVTAVVTAVPALTIPSRAV